MPPRLVLFKSYLLLTFSVLFPATYIFGPGNIKFCCISGEGSEPGALTGGLSAGEEAAWPVIRTKR